MQSSNKRIARNTLMLYIRTFVMMPVSLYTSRIILEVLGENDFGVYNVVGGFIALLSFINSAMTKATQRFLNVELGKGNHDRVSRVYSMSLLIHFAIAVFIGFVLETVGLYFFETKLNIPPETQDAARVVYHISVVTACLHFIRIPDESSIIAYERMSFFAYVSIIEVMAKLGTVFLLFWAEDNRLVLYAVALMTVGILLNIIYAIYCKRNFTTCRFRFYFDIKLLNAFLFFMEPFRRYSPCRIHTRHINTFEYFFHGCCQCGNGGSLASVQCCQYFGYKLSESGAATDCPVLFFRG